MQKDSIHQEQVNLEEPSLSDLYPEYEQQNLKMPNLMLNNEEFMDILQKNPDFENFYPDRYLRSRKLFAEKLKFSEYYFSLILYLNEDSPLMIDLIKDLMNNQTFLKQISFDLIWKIFENLIERGKKEMASEFLLSSLKQKTIKDLDGETFRKLNSALNSEQLFSKKEDQEYVSELLNQSTGMILQNLQQTSGKIEVYFIEMLIQNPQSYKNIYQLLKYTQTYKPSLLTNLSVSDRTKLVDCLLNTNDLDLQKLVATMVEENIWNDQLSKIVSLNKPELSNVFEYIYDLRDSGQYYDVLIGILNNPNNLSLTYLFSKLGVDKQKKYRLTAAQLKNIDNTINQLLNYETLQNSPEFIVNIAKYSNKTAEKVLDMVINSNNSDLAYVAIDLLELCHSKNREDYTSSLKNILYEKLYKPNLPKIQQKPSQMLVRQVHKDDKNNQSKNILLGGSFEEKLMIRQMKVENFMGWLKAYEAIELWAGEGYNYPPVEEIVSFKLASNGKVTVITKIGGVSWYKYSALFDKELKHSEKYDLPKQLDYALEKIGVSHQHLHDENLVVSAGMVGSLDPRFHIIDFDMSIRDFDMSLIC
jgi:hypothetical protein